MKYRTTGTRLGHKLMVRKRETLFDKKKQYSNFNGILVDHQEMKSHVFADFQKQQFQQMKKDKKRVRMVLLITVLITLLLVIGFLLFWNNYDFNLLKSSEF